MPKYVYYCEKCEGEFEVRHSLKETVQICQLCEAPHGVVRRPSAIFLSKKTSDLGKKNKVGSVVRETIEEATQELRAEQKKLTKREYKKNE